jgi:hypothetical protein
MKTSTRKQPKRPTAITGQDQLLTILLRTMYCKDSDACTLHFLAYRDRARQILNSPHAFDLGSDMLNLTDCVQWEKRLDKHG